MQMTRLKTKRDSKATRISDEYLPSKSFEHIYLASAALYWYHPDVMYVVVAICLIYECVGQVPFLVEKKFRELGADFSAGADWSVNVCVAGKLITGQNPQSSAKCAQTVIEMLA